MGGRAPQEARRVIWVNRFFHPDESATAIMLTDLVQALAGEGGDEHHVVTSNASYALREDGSAARLPGVIVHRIAALGSSNASLLVRLVNFALFYLGALFHLLRLARRGDAIVALTDPPLVGVVSAFVARVKGARLIHWVQDIFPETAARLGIGREGSLFHRGLRHLRNSSWRRAAKSVAIGEHMRRFVIAGGAAPERVAVIQNWAGDEAIRPVASADNALRRSWDYGEEDCVVGYSGNLGRAHDVETMIGAMRALDGQAARGLRFLFIGGGARQGSLRKAAEDLPYELIAFRPYQKMEMLAQSLSVPDVHWISLRPELEGLIVPSKLYGVLAVARPVVFVGDEQGEVARIIAEAECGASFSPGAGAELAAYLAELGADAELRQRLGASGRAYLERHLRRSSRIGEWRDLLAGLD